MVKETLLYIKYVFQNSINKKERASERLKDAFGQIKNESFNFKMIQKYFRNKNNSEAYQVLSERTCNDLDFDELFMFVDRTNSKVGQQYLYNKLRAIKIDEKQINLDERIIDKLLEDSKLRISIQKDIEKLNHSNASYITTLFQDKHLAPPKWFFILKLLSFASLLSLILSFIEPLFLIVLIMIFCVNFAFHYWNKKNLFQYLDSIPQLLKLNSIASFLHTNSFLKELDSDLPKSIKLINAIKNRMYFFELETKLKGDGALILWLIFEIFKTQFLLEPLLLFDVLKRLNTKRKEIEDVFKFVGHIDMLISIASLRSGLDTFCIPDIATVNGPIIANKIRHPLISDCVANSIKIADESILLTGSNMSGKTSFIRAVGLNVITGLTINTCFAKTFSFPLFRIFSVIRINDDVMNDKSYFFEEVLSIKEIIKESKKEQRNLFLLDEMFKGTNTVERISASKAVLSNISNTNNFVFSATHDIELTDMLSDKYRLYHFSETVNNRTVGFDYKLKKGRLKNRNAIKILEINDYPMTIIKEALEISKELDETYLSTKKASVKIKAN